VARRLGIARECKSYIRSTKYETNPKHKEESTKRDRARFVL
jgi:hypothetical protein